MGRGSNTKGNNMIRNKLAKIPLVDLCEGAAAKGLAEWRCIRCADGLLYRVCLCVCAHGRRRAGGILSCQSDRGGLPPPFLVYSSAPQAPARVAMPRYSLLYWPIFWIRHYITTKRMAPLLCIIRNCLVTYILRLQLHEIGSKNGVTLGGLP